MKQEKSHKKKKETRLCGPAVRGGCSLSALNKQEAGRCVQKADGIQQAGMGWEEMQVSLEQLGGDGSFRISLQESLLDSFHRLELFIGSVFCKQ